MQCLPWIFWKARLGDNDLMKMVFQIVCTSASTMSIVDGKEAAFWPSCWVFLLRSGHVQNDGNSIFIVISLDALMRVCRITCDQAVGLGGVLRVLEVFQRVGWWYRAFLWTKEVVIRLESLVEGVDDV